MDKLLPYKAEDRHDFFLAVQTTYFRCGGLALGILLSHKIADGSSVVTFAKSWAAIAVSRDGEPLLKFDAATYFPPMQDAVGLEPTWVVTREKLAVRMFAFPTATISLLQERYSGVVGSDSPSRVEALSAFILTQYLTATGKIHSVPGKTYAVSHALNLRSWVDPPLSAYHISNIVGDLVAVLAARDCGVEVVKKIREAVKRGHVDVSEDLLKELKSMLFGFSFSSLSRYPLYEVDFGWGRPVRVTVARFPIKNMVFF